MNFGVDGGSEDAYLGLVLNLHLRGSKELGVNPLRHPRVDLLPRRPDRQTEVERPGDREHNHPDDIPQVRVQEEQDQVHDVHDGQRERNLVAAQGRAEVLVVAVQDLRPRHDGDRAAQRRRQEEVRLCELAAEDDQP